MVTPGMFDACMGRIDERLEAMSQGMALLTGQLAGIEKRLDRIEALPQRWLIVGVVLVALQIAAQVGTPFLNAALLVTGDRGVRESGVREGLPRASLARALVKLLGHLAACASAPRRWGSFESTRAPALLLGCRSPPGDWTAFHSRTGPFTAMRGGGGRFLPSRCPQPRRAQLLRHSPRSQLDRIRSSSRRSHSRPRRVRPPPARGRRSAASRIGG